ncbi:hypothetical protein BD289DRAFT_484356 [Coniella lustricola]|uniref:Uncharacterized protein n=1 Tax=Coniella lustricola TaxID=2025994 RepID=A0A2T3A2B8_9PEZI|nr:hypothetical protein BD289DRAFT_484356 [Coniella lustricola]
MNRFKTKKKAGKDAESVDSRPSLETDNSFSLFRRGGKKAPEQEVKAEVDLALALPSNDDFRTSLLMSGLSARFSMLREQDDPTSKIGKASDDSVLFPNRQSRLNFGLPNNNNLDDIAEVESLLAPPFLRKDSSASTESSGMMTRSRPLESNVLFGGRQKVYKIPAGVPSSKNLADGMSGRALYDDDVSMSAFQKWRQAEKDREPTLLADKEDGENAPIHDEERGPEETSYITRAGSPLPQGYNQKRETSSTTSSAPSGGRNSTAATSVISQSNTTSQDSHTVTSAVSTPTLERSVTRTRKLYEQGLTQNLQDQQHSVLTRVDTLARRPAGARTPDLGPNTPSPTTQTFSDRWAAWGGDRRTVLTKASAPNLRSFSPPTTGSLNGSMNLDTRVATDAKTGIYTSPPLSPPISDAGMGEQPAFPTTSRATNLFHKPMPFHDDAKSAPRQLQQPQSGRQTPVQTYQDETQSTPGTQAQSVEPIRTPEPDTKPTFVSLPQRSNIPEHSTEAVSYNEPIESPILNEHTFQAPTSPEVRLERPSDQDHPAFRFASPQAADEHSLLPNSSLLPNGSQKPSLSDSPTLGPNTGLGGMVRHHLRSESDVSSIYAAHSDSYQSPPQKREEEEQKSNYGSPDSEEQVNANVKKNTLPRVEEVSTALQTSQQQSSTENPRSPDEEDEFAEQLANARRRVRERLTSYVEPEPASFSPPSMAAPTTDLPPPPTRSNPLGILKVKSSRGSLVDRGREAVPPPIKELDDGVDIEARLNEEDNAHPSLRAFRQARRDVQKRKDMEAMSRNGPPNGRPIMPGNAEPLPTEFGARHGTVRTPSSERQRMPLANHHTYHPMRENSPQHTPQPPPRSMSRAERERSGSENSEGSARSRSRPPNMRERSDFHQSQYMSPEIPAVPPPRHHMMRLPGAPGPDMRRSPHMPPINAFQSNHRPNNVNSYHDGSSGHPMPHMRGPPERAMTGPMPSGPFPLSPPTGRYDPSRATFQPQSGSGSAPPTPSMRPLRRPSVPSNAPLNGNISTINDSMRRQVNKRDISEPTFVMSTSQVPTTNLPASAPETPANRSRSGSFVDASAPPPPLPPVNPRRRRDSSRTRTIIGGLTGSRRTDEADGSGAFSASTPQLPIAPFARAPEENRVSAFDEDDVKTARRRLRKASPEMKMDMRATSSASKRANSPQVTNIGPPNGVVTGEFFFTA